MTSHENLRPALFADRDGTIIAEVEYLSDPDGVFLIPGAAGALRAFADAGYAIVIVTNQSGIARGFYTEDDYQRVNARVLRLLADEGVPVDGVYHCPHHPSVNGLCDCRKPGTGMYLQAAGDLGLDVRRSIFVGDRRRDTDPALALGGRGILVRTGHGRGEVAGPEIGVAEDLADVAAQILPLDTPDCRK